MRIKVSTHAVQRYVERIGGTEAEARAVLSGRAVEIAAEFGAHVVRLPRGRVLLEHNPLNVVVLTVVPLGHLPSLLIPPTWGGPPSIAFERAFHPRHGDDA